MKNKEIALGLLQIIHKSEETMPIPLKKREKYFTQIKEEYTELLKFVESLDLVTFNCNDM